MDNAQDAMKIIIYLNLLVIKMNLMENRANLITILIMIIDIVCLVKNLVLIALVKQFVLVVLIENGSDLIINVRKIVFPIV